MNVYLGAKVRAGGAPDLAGFTAATMFPLLTGKTPNGEVANLKFDKPTVVYIFSPNCGWCKEDYPNLKAIQASLASKYRFVGVSLSSAAAPERYHQAMKGYLEQFPFPGEVIFVDPEQLDPRSSKDIRLTPQTIVVGAGGLIEKSWAGALMDARHREAQRFFRISLPGIAATE